MPNDTSTGGYLVPSSAPPPDDTSLDAILQQLVVGLTGLPGNLVRPRWQPVVPKQPEPAVNWCALGVTGIEPDDTPAIVHGNGATGQGVDTMYRHETIQALCSFYGPNGQQYAAQTRDGLCLPQNNDLLKPNLMALVGVDVVRAAPELVNQQWVRRFDFAVTFRRQVVRTYPVLNIASATVATVADTPLLSGAVNIQSN